MSTNEYIYRLANQKRAANEYKRNQKWIQNEYITGKPILENVKFDTQSSYTGSIGCCGDPADNGGGDPAGCNCTRIQDGVLFSQHCLHF